MSLKQEMLDFIKQPIPAGLGIVPHSIPVLFFGNTDTATAATMAINPSRMAAYCRSARSVLLTATNSELLTGTA